MVVQNRAPISRITALLGPTNTGKTYLAMDRMLGHASGMIGFPLRLLARENYDRAVQQKGVGSVALITGEERILPPNARWFVCTVESMPVDRKVDFLAIDEIQLAADLERGHIFTDRLLHARGLAETMFLGSQTVKPLCERLVPEAEFISRPRLSRLTYSGTRKLARLERRSALVCFSSAELYELAEAIRRQRGGCAVVLGALSPRARNAQVALYQSGEVDFMVATDAIGMGLNMDLDHVCFARLSKFDGRTARHLTPAELAQIAGRAGRYMKEGRFATTHDVGNLDAELVEALEAHRFDPVTTLFWRNNDLDFSSLDRLQASLEQKPPRRFLQRKRDADDHCALLSLSKNSEIARKAKGSSAVALLWEVCQIPDFRKTMTDRHLTLLTRLYSHLTGASGRLPVDWVAKHIKDLDCLEGEIDRLLVRIAHIRTWTYISHRPDWLLDAAFWQEKTRAIEDRLSERLHEKLTQRFVDRRGAYLARRREGAEGLLGGVLPCGEVVIEGLSVGRLEGLSFAFHPTVTGEEARRSMGSVRRLLASEIAQRSMRLISDAKMQGHALSWAADGVISWNAAPIANLRRGASRSMPDVEILTPDLLDGQLRSTVKQALCRWFSAQIQAVLAPLFDEPPDIGGAVRGILFQLREGLGSIARKQLTGVALDRMTAVDRCMLRQLRVTIGYEAVFLAHLAKPRPLSLRALLDAVYRGMTIPALPKGSVALRVAGLPSEWYAAIGYRILGERAMSLARVEKLAFQARILARAGAKTGSFQATPCLLAAAGCRSDELPDLLAALGYRAIREQNRVTFCVNRRKKEEKTGRPDHENPPTAPCVRRALR